MNLTMARAVSYLFGEAKRVHCQSMNERDWVLGNDSVDELYEYVHLSYG